MSEAIQEASSEPESNPNGSKPAARKSVKTNIVLNAFRTVTSLVFPIITFPYTSRILGPEGVGKIQFATAFVGYFSLLASIGIPLYGIRQIAKARDDRQKLHRTAQSLLVLHLATSVLALLAFFCILPFHPKLATERWLFSIVASSIVLTALGMDWLYQGLEEYAYITKRSLIVSTLSTASVFIFVHNKEDYLIAATITVVATLGSSVLNFWNARKFVFFKCDEPIRPFEHFKPLMMVFALNFIVSIYVNLDTVMLGFLSSSKNVGYYATAMRLTKMLLAVVMSMGAVLVPRLSYYVERGLTSEFDSIVRKSFSLVTLLCLPCVAALMILSREILIVFAGGQFGESSTCMILTAPVILMIGITNILGIQILYPLGKEKLVVLSVAGGAVVSVALNLILIPTLAHIGAAIGALISETAVLGIQVILIAKHRPVPYPWKSAFLYAMATLAMSLALFGLRYVTPSLPLRLIVGIPSGAGIYFGLLFAFKDEFLLDNFRLIKGKVLRHA